MTRLKFMNAPVDEKAHHLAHAIEGAERAAEMGFNWVFLAYNWGFPPEVEEAHWESFYSALNHYHRAGLKVFGYIQASNCVYEGSYADKDWYAHDPWGHKIPVYSTRYFTSLCHAGWLAEVRERVRQLAESGADGIFFDNPWQGGIGIDVAEMPLGFIGSHDSHSRQAYAAAFNGAGIPLVVDTRDPATQQYLRWRAGLAVNALRDWVQAARDINPDIVIAANNFDPVVHNSYSMMGMDLVGLSAVQNVMVAENFSLPRLQEDGAVIANAITIDAARARSDQTPVSSLPYINGVGFDRVFEPRQWRRLLAEGIAMQAPTVVRGATFLYRNEYTTLLHRRYAKQQAALQDMNAWLVTNQDWLNRRQPISPLAVYHPYLAARWEWNQVSSLFFAACQVLLQNGYPLRIVGDDDDWQHVQTLIVPPGDVEGLDDRLQAFASQGGRIIPLGQARAAANRQQLWTKWRPIPHRVPRIKRLRKAINQGAALSWRLYHRSRFARWVAERLDLHLQTTRSPLFFMPPDKYSAALLTALGEVYPQVQSEQPVLLSGWQEPDGTQQWHLVNYGRLPQKVTLDMNNLVRATLYTMDGQAEPVEVVGSALMFSVDVGRVVRLHLEG